jgi:hypothetical protein
MVKVILFLFASISIASAVVGNWATREAKAPQQTSQAPVPPSESPIKVTITTVESSLGPPRNHYRVGGQIPVTITMTNSSSVPVYACISSDLYQNVPKLTKDGAVVPYMKWQSYERLNAQKNHICNEENIPEPVLLPPNEPTVADFFVLVDSRTSTGAEAWYDGLPPGKYELSIQRRLSCCDGPMLESNKISFEVEP